MAIDEVEGAAPESSAAIPIVGIGASAGGLAPLEALSKRLGRDGIAFVVLQHLPPQQEATLADILSRSASLNVVTVENGMKVEANTIYVAPTDLDVALQDGAIHLVRRAAEHAPAHGIDVFFRSLAADRGTAAIGVVLSGMGSDGTLGLRAIKESGGIALVQDPSTAAHPNMPQAAIDAGCADLVLTPEQIGDEIVRVVRDARVAKERPEAPFDDAPRNELLARLRDAFGVDFTRYKQTTIERRIRRRMALQRIEHFPEYVAYVAATPAEVGLLYGDLLIGVTSFFRDKEPFEALKQIAFPRLLERRKSGNPIRIWVPACSTGEEAYSIAMVILEYLRERDTQTSVQIFATDIDEHALARARSGLYPHTIEMDVSEEHLDRFFTRTDEGWQVRRALRDAIVFAKHDVAKDPPYSRIDLVSCRNVLIYLEPAVQKKVLQLFEWSLAPDGFLLLGTAESIGGASDLFSLVDPKAKLYQRKVAGAAVVDFVSVPPHVREHVKERTMAPSVLQLADRKVLEKYAPPGVVVNDRLEIVQFRGKTGRFIEPSSGVASLNILKQVRSELVPELRLAIDKALADNTPVVSPPLRLRPSTDDDEPTTVVLVVTALRDADDGRHALVLFEERPAAPAEPSAPSDVTMLERELATTEDYLESAIEDLETVNEALQTSNEELQTANEELQSANEELASSKDELQRTNEELVVVNEELHKRMGQLAVANDDLRSVLGHATAAIFLVDERLQIRRCSRAAERLFGAAVADVGRPLGYLRALLQARDLEATVSEVIDTGRPREQPVRSNDGHGYTMRIVPHRTSDPPAIRGAVIELLTTASADPNEAAILAALPHPYAVVDDELRIVWGNDAFLRLFGAQREIVGRPLEDIWRGKVDEPALWARIEQAALKGTEFEHVATDGPLAGARRKFSARALTAANARKVVLLAIDDLTS